MRTINVIDFRECMDYLIRVVVETNQSIKIRGKIGDVIMISEACWNVLQEALYSEDECFNEGEACMVW